MNVTVGKLATCVVGFMTGRDGLRDGQITRASEQERPKGSRVQRSRPFNKALIYIKTILFNCAYMLVN